jgi:long-chain acyl-CoA synthetase
MNIAGLFARSAGRAGDLPALGLGSRPLRTYAELARRLAAIAGGLRGLGLAPGDRVALVMRNCPDYVELMAACWWAGLVAVPVNVKLHRSELAWILEHSGARVAFVSDDMAAQIDAVPGLERVIVAGSPEARKLDAGEPLALAEAAPGDLAWLFYTSGTTGRPKGAMISHGNLLAMTAAFLADVDRIEPGEAIFHAGPLSHGSGIYILPHAARGACQVVPESGGFDEAELFAAIAAWPGTRLFAAPTMVKRLVRHARAHGPDLANLATIVYGGAPMYLAELDEAHEVLGFRLAQIYGQGESPMTITALDKGAHADRAQPRWREWLTSAGTAQLGMGRCGSPTPRGGRGRRPRWARSWPAGPPSSPATGATPRPAAGPWATAGCGPAMWACSTATASSTSRTARRTSSSRAA